MTGNININPWVINPVNKTQFSLHLVQIVKLKILQAFNLSIPNINQNIKNIGKNEYYHWKISKCRLKDNPTKILRIKNDLKKRTLLLSTYITYD